MFQIALSAFVMVFLAVGLGYFLSRAVPIGWIKAVHCTAGVLFILVGVWTIWKA